MEIKNSYISKETMRELINVLDAMLGPVLLGALTDDEIIKDYGNLGLNIVQRGRKLLDQVKEEVQDDRFITWRKPMSRI